MSDTPPLIRVMKRLESVLDEDIADALHPRGSALTQYRAVITARRNLVEVEQMLSQVEEGLAAPAVEEWERIRRPDSREGAHPDDEELEDDINF